MICGINPEKRAGAKWAHSKRGKRDNLGIMFVCCGEGKKAEKRIILKYLIQTKAVTNTHTHGSPGRRL